MLNERSHVLIVLKGGIDESPAGGLECSNEELFVFLVVFKAGNTWLGQERSADSCVQQKKPRFEEPEWTVADRNHETILLIPDILARLVKLLTLDKVSFNREVRKLTILRTPCTDLELFDAAVFC